MTTLRIYDYRDSGVLALDLRDLVGLLVPRSLEANWTVLPVRLKYPELGRTLDEFMVTGPGGDQLERLAASGSSVGGQLFAEYARATHQVIWGQFVATVPEQVGPWVVIKGNRQYFLRNHDFGCGGPGKDPVSLQGRPRCICSDRSRRLLLRRSRTRHLFKSDGCLRFAPIRVSGPSPLVRSAALAICAATSAI